MVVYTVHEPPNPPSSRLETAERLLFIKEGFSWGAFLVPPLWFLFKGEWRGLVAYLALASLVGVFIDANVNPATAQALMLTLNLIAGFEASNLLRFSRRRSGWREIAAVSGASRDECERRFFEAWLSGLENAPAQAVPIAGPQPAAGRGKGVKDKFGALANRLRQRLAPKH